MKEEYTVIDGTIAAEDPITEECSLKTISGKRYRLFGSGQRILIREKDIEIGLVMRSSTWSGSLWKNGQCIGEYSLVNGKYKVVPMVNGFLEPEATQHAHPIDFLLQKS